MPVIHEDDTFTQIVVFDVAPSRQAGLIAAIVAEVERWVRHRPGFISSSFHASHDGRRVINYAQWRSADDFHAFGQDAQGERLQHAIQLAEPDGPPVATHCRVVRTITAHRGDQ